MPKASYDVLVTDCAKVRAYEYMCKYATGGSFLIVKEASDFSYALFSSQHATLLRLVSGQCEISSKTIMKTSRIQDHRLTISFTRFTGLFITIDTYESCLYRLIVCKVN